MAGDPPVSKAVTVKSQIRIIQIVSCAEIGVAFIILLCQSIAIAADYAFATRSLTGIWTSMFFFIASILRECPLSKWHSQNRPQTVTLLSHASLTFEFYLLALLWSYGPYTTFNGLLMVLIFQIIACTMSIPLFTACCVLLGVYVWTFSPDEAKDEGVSLLGSSIAILVTNSLMSLAALVQLGLNAYNAYKLYLLAYGGQPKENNYDHRSISSGEGVEEDVTQGGGEGNNDTQEAKSSSDPAMPSPPPDLRLAPTDILIIKYCGVTTVILALIIFVAQTTMLAVGNDEGIRISIGIWGSVFYVVTGIFTVYSGYKTTSQSAVIIFVLNLVQFILSVAVVCVAYYILAAFGSCLQNKPFANCTYTNSTGFGAADLTVTLMAGVMAFIGMVEGLLSLILILICAQAVCGFRCMISGATVYPTF